MDDRLLERVKDLNRGIAIRPAGPGDGRSFVDLLNRQYNRQRDESYFRWRFLEAPHRCRLFLACEGALVVGAYGVEVLPLSDGQKCAFTVDLVVAGTFRNRGIFYLLEDEACRFASAHGCEAIACLPNALGMRAHAAIAGWQNLGAVPMLVAGRVSPVRDLPPGDDRASSSLLSFGKGAEHRRWRYDGSPLYHYRTVKAGGLRAVIKLFADPVSRETYGDIVDYDDASGAPFAQLIQHAAEELVAGGATAITTWALPHTQHFCLLASMGFAGQPTARFFCLKALSEAGRAMGAFRRWHLVEGDSEVF